MDELSPAAFFSVAIGSGIVARLMLRGVRDVILFFWQMLRSI